MNTPGKRRGAILLASLTAAHLFYKKRHLNMYATIVSKLGSIAGFWTQVSQRFNVERENIH